VLFGAFAPLLLLVAFRVLCFLAPFRGLRVPLFYPSSFMLQRFRPHGAAGVQPESE
jgi:uncharacterized RDD family membrane protein YckC